MITSHSPSPETMRQALDAHIQEAAAVEEVKIRAHEAPGIFAAFKTNAQAEGAPKQGDYGFLSTMIQVHVDEARNNPEPQVAAFWRDLQVGIASLEVRVMTAAVALIQRLERGDPEAEAQLNLILSAGAAVAPTPQPTAAVKV